VFPISMVSFFALLAMVLAARGQYLAAGISGALGSFTYSTGFFTAAPLAIAVLLDRKLTLAGKALALARAPLPCASGFLAAVADHRDTVGWGAFFRVQREFYGNGIFNPLETFFHNTIHVWLGDLQPDTVPHVQTLLIAILVVAVLVSYARRWREIGTLEAVLLVHML